MRGEQAVRRSVIFPFVGSPPLARGTDLLGEGGLFEKGITPACAGNRKRK